MLLIQGDFFKAFWLTIFPIVELTGVHVETSNPFCQISGFFLAVGIEACDVIVLLVAVHAALYLFRPKRSGGSNGLYPYRRSAYLLSVGFPLVMASLAYVKGSPGYFNIGSHCYLSVKEDWYRQYLSWVPRYVIFSVIIAIKISMYSYVRIQLSRYSRRSSTPQTPQLVAGPHPQTPPLEYHGLIDISSTLRRPTRASFRNWVGGTSSRDGQSAPDSVPSLCATLSLSRSRRASRLSESSQPSPRPRPKPGEHQQPLGLENWDFKETEAAAGPAEGKRDMGPTDVTPVADPVERPAPIRYPSPPGTPGPAPTRPESRSFYQRPLCPSPPGQPVTMVGAATTATITSPSLQNMIAFLRRGPPRPGSAKSSPSPILFLSPSGVADSTGMTRTRNRTRRQLRLLFLYPVVYIVTWSVPFVLHVLDLDGSRRASAPLWLAALAAASVCSQGSIDCVLFMTQEKPWRHVRAGFWAGLAPRLRPGWGATDATLGGRTREEMLDDERFARTRRDDETNQENADRDERVRVARESPLATPRRRKGGTNWWDAEMDGWASSDDEDGTESDEQDARGNGASRGSTAEERTPHPETV